MVRPTAILVQLFHCNAVPTHQLLFGYELTLSTSCLCSKAAGYFPNNHKIKELTIPDGPTASVYIKGSLRQTHHILNRYIVAKFRAIMSKFIGSLLVIILLVTVGIESFTLLPLYGYVQETYHTHLYTYNASIIGYTYPGNVGRHGYKSEGIVCLLNSEGSGKHFYNCIFSITFIIDTAIPLYHYNNEYENLYTTNSSEAGRNYKYEGIVGHCYGIQEPHTVPLYRYSKTVRARGRVYTDHYYTTDANKIGLVTPGTTGKNEYTYEGVACFVYNVKYH